MNGEALLAVKEGNLEKLDALLNQGINIDAQDDNGLTLLHHAASNSKPLVVYYLLQNGANIFTTTKQNYTALHIAISNTESTYTNVLEAIIDNVTRKELRKLLDMKIKDRGNSALHIACEDQDIESCYANTSFLLLHGANFEMRNDAGEKPVDIAKSEPILELFKLIDASFAKAKSANKQLISDFEKYDFVSFNAALGCRNNKGRTIMQVVLMTHDDRLSRELLWLRTNMALPEYSFHCKYYERVTDMDMLAKKIEEYHEMWLVMNKGLHGIAGTLLSNPFINTPPNFVTNFVKKCCLVLEKAHELLLAYRKFSGQKSSITSVPMRAIEEVLELLGFDPDRIFVIVGEETCYYKKLPAEWKKNHQAFLRLTGGVVHSSIGYFWQFLEHVRLIHAVKDNDLDKVQKILNSTLYSMNYVDQPNNDKQNNALRAAVTHGNEKMIKLFLEAGAEVVQNHALSLVYFAAEKGQTKFVKMLLDKVKAKDMAELLDCQRYVESTALHAAAKKGHLDVVKILLSHGASYSISDGKGRTPMDVSVRNKEVSDFFKLVDGCFHEAKEANVELAGKLKAMQTNDFTAVANARNHKGATLAVVATKAGAKNLASFILKLIQRAKQRESEKAD